MRQAFVVYDSDLNDNPRVQKAERGLAAALLARNVAAHSVRLPSTAEGRKQGADDFLKAHGKVKFLELVRAAQPLSVDDSTKGCNPVLESFADMEVEDVDWLWKHRIAAGMLNAIVGNPGEGKSTLAMEIAACGSRGFEPWTKQKIKPFSTIYMSNENVHTITSMPRLLAMGGDTSRIAALDAVASPDGTKRSINLDDVEAIEKAIRQKDAKLVIIDPLQSYLGARVDSNQANQTRAKLDPLVAIAKRTGAAFIIVSHTPKHSSSRAIHSMLGSVDIAGAMRSIMMVGTPASSPDNRVLLMVKNSVGPRETTLGFRIVKAQGRGSPTRIEWQGPVNVTFEDLHAPQRSSERHRSKKEGASEWLRAALSDGKSHLVTDLYRAWSEESGLELGDNSKGPAERVLQVAAKLIGVERTHVGGSHGKRGWKLRGRTPSTSPTPCT